MRAIARSAGSILVRDFTLGLTPQAGVPSRASRLGWKTLCCRALRALLAIFLLMSVTALAYGQVDTAAELQKEGPTALVDDAASRAFNEAKNWIGAGAWAAAAEKLNLVIAEHANSKYYEPAIYWLAYVRKQQERYQDALLLLNKFIKDFPQSRWAGDARTLRVEIAAQVGNTEIINEELRNADNDEVKLAALSGLLRLDTEKGSRQAAEIIGSNTGNRNFREGVVNLIGRYGGQDAARVLLTIVENRTEQEVVRTAAIFALKRHINESVLARLIELVMKGDAPAVVEAAMFIFLQQENEWAKAVLVKVAGTAQLTDTRRRAIHFLSKLKSGAAIDELIGLYDLVEDVGVKRQILATLSKTGNPSAQARVFDIARVTDDTGIREEGLLSLGNYGHVQIIARIIQLYDAETRDEVKAVILSALSKSRHKSALDKLTNVAQYENSIELRRKAAQLLKRRVSNSATRKIIEI